MVSTVQSYTSLHHGPNMPQHLRFCGMNGISHFYVQYLFFMSGQLYGGDDVLIVLLH
jgi:hypothetical protein